MRALVTGSAGFIGTHLVEAMIGRGYRVTGIDRHSRPAFESYEHTVLDLAAPQARRVLSELALDVDVVFHLAARPGVRGSSPATEAMRWRDNVVSTANLLAATPATTQVVATSSSSVYGDAGATTGWASTESDPVRPKGGYALSKVEMERICALRRARGGAVAVVRPFTVAGEGQRADMAFSLWFEALRKGEPIRLFGSGQRTRDITDVRDAVECLIRAAELEINETVNLGTGVGHRLIDMARAVLTVSGRPGRIVHEPVGREEVAATLADTARCRRLLGFTPETNLDDLLRRQLEATRPQPATSGSTPRIRGKSAQVRALVRT